MNPFLLAALPVAALPFGLAAIGLRSLPNLPYNVKRTRQESADGFDALLVPEWLVQSRPHSVVLNEDGALMTGFMLTGPDATTQTQAALARLSDDLNAVFSGAEVGWMFELQRTRRPAGHPMREPFVPTATHAVLAEARDAAPRCWQDDVRLLVTYLPPEGVSASISRLLVSRAPDDSGANRDNFAIGLAALEDGCRRIEATLKSCMVSARRLHGDRDSDELVDTLYRNVNGWTLPRVLLDLNEDPQTGFLDPPVPLRETLAVQDFDGGLALRYGKEHIRCLSIVAYPAKRRPALLAALAALPIPYRDHSRIIVGHPDALDAHLKIRFNDAADDATPVHVLGKPAPGVVTDARVSLDAVARLKDVQKTLAEHRSGERQYAWYSRILELRSESVEELDRYERLVSETLRQAGFGVRTEDLHAVDAWLSTLGGNGYDNVRRTAAHGVMIGDLTNLTDSWRGREVIKCDKCPPGVQPMAWVRRADTLSPFALDLHAAGGDVMSALIVGPTGAGKSTLINFLMAHFAKTSADRVIGIDYKKSGERTTVMLEGAYSVPGESAARLCPFTAIDTDAGFTRAVEWCELVAKLNMPAHLVTGELVGRFAEAVGMLRSSPTWYQEACMTLFVQKLSTDRETKAAFKHYADGGIYGGIFDATPLEMAETYGAIRVYDTTVLHELKERAVFPALAILFADAEREMDGRRTLLVVEEAHIAFRHSVMEPWLLRSLRTNRKKHAGIVFVLTDLAGISESTLDVLRTQCATTFATPNPNANVTRTAYRSLGFRDAVIDQLSSGPRYRYWQVGEDGIAPFMLDLSEPELQVFAKGSDRDKAITHTALQDDELLDLGVHEVPAAIFEATGNREAAAAWRAYSEAKHASAWRERGMLL